MQVRPKENIRTEKVVLLGPSSAGKTSLVNRIIQDKFNASMQATVGAAFMTKILDIDGTKIKLNIWDTGGSEKYKSLAPMYYRDARGVIIVYDLTNKESVHDAQMWVDEVRQNGQDNLIIVAAANKADLEDKRAVTHEEVDDFAFVNQLECYRETSALTGQNVSDLFEEFCKLLVKLPPLPKSDEEVFVNLNQARSTPSSSNYNYNSNYNYRQNQCSC